MANDTEKSTLPNQDCPGRFKCHGPAGWCNDCGDVDLICDDPRCCVHQRGSDIQLQLEIAFRDKETAWREYGEALARWQHLRRMMDRWESGNPVMVSRANPARGA